MSSERSIQVSLAAVLLLAVAASSSLACATCAPCVAKRERLAAAAEAKEQPACTSAKCGVGEKHADCKAAKKQLACGTAKCGTAKCGTAKCGVAGKKSCGKTTAAAINTKGLQALLATGTSLTLLDARAGQYDDGRRIPGARQLGAGSSEADILAAVPDKSGLIVTYCTNLKCGASATLAGKLRAAGYVNVLEFPQGIEGWVAGGNKVVEEK